MVVFYTSPGDNSGNRFCQEHTRKQRHMEYTPIEFKIIFMYFRQAAKAAQLM